MVRAAMSTVSVIVLAACASAAGQPAARSSPSGPAAGEPVRVMAVPVSAPAAIVKVGCFVPGENGGGTTSLRGVVTVDPHPVGAVAEWLPGLDQRPCRAQLTHIAEPAARRLAAAVNAGQAVKVGAAYSCPSDNGAAVRLFFQFPGRVSEVVSVELSGCRFVTAPGRVGRFTSAAAQAELGELAPPSWRP